MAEIVWSVIAILGCLAVVGVILYALVSGRDDRDEDEAARDYFTEHGHWPDEAPVP